MKVEHKAKGWLTFEAAAAAAAATVAVQEKDDRRRVSRERRRTEWEFNSQPCL